MYDPMFDHDGDGKLSDSEMMDKAYFESEVMVVYENRYRDITANPESSFWVDCF